MSSLKANVRDLDRQTDKLSSALWGFMVFTVQNYIDGVNICAPKEKADEQTPKQTGVRKKCDASQTNRYNKYPERLTIYGIDCSRSWRAFFFSSQEGTDTPGGMSDGEITATLICPADMDRLISMFLSQQVLSLHAIIGRPKKKKERQTQTRRQCLRK